MATTILRIADEPPERTREAVRGELVANCVALHTATTAGRLRAAGINGLADIQAEAIATRTRVLELLEEFIATYETGGDILSDRIETVEDRMLREASAQNCDPLREGLVADAGGDDRYIDHVGLAEWLGEIGVARIVARAIAEVLRVQLQPE